MSETFERMTRAELAALGREYLLAGHLIDRAGMPFVVVEFGREAMRDVAIDEWMGASPVYTRRIRRALRFDGDDVVTIFKGMQFDIGAPHQFMDFRFRVLDARHGEFHLASCGALMDVEPLGQEFVVTMCHHIEDPTFDATAAATNPRARMRPVHRPPRVPANRLPHCLWTVEIDDEAEPLPEPPGALRLATSRAATIDLTRPLQSAEPGGDDDYAGEMDPDLELERFSHPTLVLLLQEIALQGHLLARSFMHAVDDRWGGQAAERLGARQMTGVAGLVAKRLGRLLGTSGGLADIARVLELHPALHPRAYVDARVEVADDLVVSIGRCPALEEGDALTWPAQMVAGTTQALEAIAHAIDPLAIVRPVEREGVVAAWSVDIDRDAEPARTSQEVLITSFTTGAEFQFTRRGT